MTTAGPADKNVGVESELVVLVIVGGDSLYGSGLCTSPPPSSSVSSYTSPRLWNIWGEEQPMLH